MTRLLMPLLAFLCLLPSVAAAAPRDEAKAVAAAMDQLHRAMIDQDRATLRKLTEEALTYGHSTGATEDQATFLGKLAPYADIQFRDPVVVVRGRVAWVRGVMAARMRNANGGTDPIEFKILYVFVKEGGWKLLARQAVK